MQAEVLAIGDEITAGQTLDTNSQWLSQRLEELGIRVLYHATVGDELEPCIAVFRQAIQRADVVVATGGLGPTADDLTRQALAEVAGRPLELDAGALEHIRGLFARRNRPMPPQNEVQATFPAGSRVIPNPHGTAPGIDLRVPRPGQRDCRVVALPGVPAEMREMWEATVRDSLGGPAGGGRVIRRLDIKCFGAGESQIEAMLPDMIRRGRLPRVGITASGGAITLRIVAEGDTEQQCLDAIEPTAAEIRRLLGDLVFGQGDQQLQDVLVGRLGRQNLTLATVECGTAGLLANWLGATAGHEAVYRGGLIACDAAAAGRLLGLDSTPLDGPAAVEVLAVACRRRFEADVALAVGPLPIGEPNAAGPKPVFLAAADPTHTVVKALPSSWQPALLRTWLAKWALNLARTSMAFDSDAAPR